MKDSFEEIFGYGYSWSYRWFRIKELVLSYITLTAMPAYWMGMFTIFGWCVQQGGYITNIQVVFPFIFFLTIMTIEDVIRATYKSCLFFK